MPDIAMCSGVRDGRACPMAGSCYRHTARPSPGRQSWFAVAPFQVVTVEPFVASGDCDYFWPVETSLNMPDSCGKHSDGE